LSLAFGAGSQLLQPLAIAVIGGVLASLPLSLIVTPVLHYALSKKKCPLLLDDRAIAAADFSPAAVQVFAFAAFAGAVGIFGRGFLIHLDAQPGFSLMTGIHSSSRDNRRTLRVTPR